MAKSIVPSAPSPASTRPTSSRGQPHGLAQHPPVSGGRAPRGTPCLPGHGLQSRRAAARRPDLRGHRRGAPAAGSRGWRDPVGCWPPGGPERHAGARARRADRAGGGRARGAARGGQAATGPGRGLCLPRRSSGRRCEHGGGPRKAPSSAQRLARAIGSPEAEQSGGAALRAGALAGALRGVERAGGPQPAPGAGIEGLGRQLGHDSARLGDGNPRGCQRLARLPPSGGGKGRDDGGHGETDLHKCPFLAEVTLLAWTEPRGQVS